MAYLYGVVTNFVHYSMKMSDLFERDNLLYKSPEHCTRVIRAYLYGVITNLGHSSMK